MEKDQVNIIRKYLLEKKLPIDILAEVEDHFISRIEGVRSGNFNFEDAFEHVKKIWENDLKIVYTYSGRSETALVKKIKNKKINAVLFKSLAFTVLFWILLVISIPYFTEEMFIEISTYSLFITLGFPAIHYMVNLKVFNTSKKYKDLKLNIYQNGNMLLIIAGLSSIVYGSSFSKFAQNIFDFFLNYSHVGLASFILLLTLSWFYFFGFLMQMAFVQSAKKINIYQYLE